MFVSYKCCVWSGTGLCDGLITLPGEAYRVYVCVCVCVCVCGVCPCLCRYVCMYVCVCVYVCVWCVSLFM